MNEWIPWILCGISALAALFLLRDPLRVLAGIAFRSVVGLGGIWLFNYAGTLIGVQVGINVLTGLTVGILGLPGFALLLLLPCL